MHQRNTCGEPWRAPPCARNCCFAAKRRRREIKAAECSKVSSEHVSGFGNLLNVRLPITVLLPYKFNAAVILLFPHLRFIPEVLVGVFAQVVVVMRGGNGMRILHTSDYNKQRGIKIARTPCLRRLIYPGRRKRRIAIPAGNLITHRPRNKLTHCGWGQ